jgi:uncharacterized repeat protein (TIGR03803 family)
MKTGIKKLFLLVALTAGAGLMPAGRVTAQTFTNLHNFTGADGASPYGSLIVSGNILYGTTKAGGSSSNGTVFRINTDGTGFTNLHSFTANSDGYYPYAGLLLDGNTLYGTAPYGGPAGNGTIFKLNTDGSGFTVLYAFPNPDHGEPYGGLIRSGDTLYGTTGEGGSLGAGSVFAIKTNGTGFTNLHTFSYEANDASSPYAGLTLAGSTLYGTTIFGGTGGGGVVFKMNIDGSGYTNIYNFTGGLDGANPQSVLILLSNTLYGTCEFGGSLYKGSVFRVNIDGSGFTNLHSFNGYEGSYPTSGLVLSGNSLYGTALVALFRINPDGSDFTEVRHFDGPSDGAWLWGPVTISANTIYGTASAGGSTGNGTVFSITLPLPPTPPSLSITRSGANVVLRWPTNSPGFTLKSATNLVSPIVWTTASPAPVVVNGQNTVTNPASGMQKYYRLEK